VKFIQAHQIAKNTIRKLGTACSMWSSATSWCSWAAACATATTKHRSKKSSSGVDARCGSSGWRATIGRYQGRRADVWVTPTP
jgi:hypothetical protein